MKMLKTVMAMASAAVLSVASMSANATLMLTIDDLSTNGIDFSTSDPAAFEAMVFHGGSVGTWTLSNTTGLGNGFSSIFGIDLNSISASSSAGGTLRIMLTETDLSLGALNSPVPVSVDIGGTTQGTISYAAWLNDSNAAFGMSSQLISGSYSYAPSGVANFSASGYAMPTATDPFSLTLAVDITHIGRKSTSFDFSASVPEPSTLALISVALLGAGAASRRRKA